MEIEAAATLDLTDPATLATILGLGEVETSVEVVHDTYLDTDDWFLFRAGLACRVRHAGGAARLLVATLAPMREGPAHHQAWLEDLPPDAPENGPLPGERVARWLAPCLGGRVLRVRLHVEHTRHTFVGVDASGARVQVYRGDDAVPVAPSDHLGQSLRAALEQGTEAPPSPPVPAGPFARDERVRAVARAIIGAQSAALRFNEPGARIGLDAEYLHDMRVAVRRTLAALDTFRAAMPGPARKRLRAATRTLLAHLGAVRDIDVTVAGLATSAAAAGVDEHRRAPLRAELHGRRDAARSALLDHLDSAAQAETLAAYTDALACLDVPEVQPNTLQDLAGQQVAARLDAVLQAGRPLGRRSPAADFHALRKLCKRLRYTAEFVRDVAPEALGGLVDHLKLLQDLLGAHQDATVGHDLVGRIARRDTVRGSAVPALRRAYRKAAAEQRAAFKACFAQLDDPAWHAELAAALGSPGSPE